jgi:hypothetical protein
MTKKQKQETQYQQQASLAQLKYKSKAHGRWQLWGPATTNFERRFNRIRHTHQHDNKANEKPKIKHVKLQILLNNEFAPY